MGFPFGNPKHLHKGQRLPYSGYTTVAPYITRWITTSGECGRGSALGNALTLLRWVALGGCVLWCPPICCTVSPFIVVKKIINYLD